MGGATLKRTVCQVRIEVNVLPPGPIFSTAQSWALSHLHRKVCTALPAASTSIHGSRWIGQS